jgi:hypothetical protein
LLPRDTHFQCQIDGWCDIGSIKAMNMLSTSNALSRPAPRAGDFNVNALQDASTGIHCSTIWEYPLLFMRKVSKSCIDLALQIRGTRDKLELPKKNPIVVGTCSTLSLFVPHFKFVVDTKKVDNLNADLRQYNIQKK